MHWIYRFETKMYTQTTCDELYQTEPVHFTVDLKINAVGNKDKIKTAQIGNRCTIENHVSL